MVNFLLLFLVFLSGCATFRSDPDCEFYRNRHGENITQHVLPVVFKIHKDVPTYMYEGIENAAKTYNEVLKEELILIRSIDSGPAMPRLDGFNVIYFMPNKKKKENNIGLADLNFYGNKIIDADIIINSIVDFTIFDLESLMLHEFGHTLGLKHTESDSESAMTENTYPGEIKRKLSTKDIINLRCGYL